MGPRASRLLRAAIVLAVAVVVGVAAWWLFLVSSSDLADVVGVLLVIAGVVVGVRVAGRMAASLLPSYNVAEVAVDGPITRGGPGSSRRCRAGPRPTTSSTRSSGPTATGPRRRSSSS